MRRTLTLSRLALVPVGLLAVTAPVALILTHASLPVIAGVSLISVLAVTGIVAVVRHLGTALGGRGDELGSEEYRTVFASLNEGVCVQDAQARIIANNPAAERILGLTANQMRGVTSLDPSWRCIHEDGSPFSGDTHPAPVTLRTGKACHAVKMGVYRGDGSLAWIEINSEPISGGAGAMPRGVVVSFIDITAQHQREVELRLAKERLDAAIGSLDSAFAMFDRDQRLVICNDDFRRLYPEAGRVQHPGSTLRELLEEFFANGGSIPGVDDPQAYVAEREASFGAQVAPIIVQVRDRWLRISEHCSRDGDVVSLRTDITELVEARNAAEAAAAAKGDFLAMMSHEIRTPMNGIIGMADLLGSTRLDRVQREYLDTVRGCADNLLVLINDILDFSKIEAGRLQLEDVNLSVLTLAEEVCIPVAEQAQAKGIELVCLIDPLVPAQICGDPSRLRQVLINLLSNAVKFTDAGEVELRVGIVDGNLSFAVRDTGIGIPAEALSRLFQSFSQVDSSTSRRFGGTGLGLVISKRLAELMQGGITVDSTPGRGSTFTFWLPLASSLGQASTLKPLTGQRILCADWHPLAREAVRRHLLAAGAVVDEAATASEVADKLHQSAYDVVILDRLMPGSTGLDFAGMPPVVLTSHLTARIADDDLATAGVAACITKPIRRTSLLSAIASALGLRPASGIITVARDATPTTLRILVVEDNLVNQRVVQAFLTRLGMTSLLVSSGIEALEALDTDGGGFDLVLMDCQMPDMDGFAATAVWRKRELPGRHLPIVALTANALAGDRELCLAAGMDDYLAKPVRLEPLREILSRWLDL